MMEHARCDTSADALILTKNSKNLFYRQVLQESLPIESQLDQFLHDPFNAVITVKILTSKQDAIDYLTWIFLYLRLPLNSNYNNLASFYQRHISDHLSCLVESTLNNLADAKCIEIIDYNDFGHLNSGMICAYYSVNYACI